ncbi:MAG: [Fe-Fe] hydrogenase large subunit C-terminal domain-containing protein [Bacillota bacterium]|nr:[Fe-Fe] hydrogenase large subunit C-terminal domain-containing protein [Bacillota bacterium]
MVSGTPAAISLAPSFPLAFAKERWPLVPGALAHLGFSIIEPTTVVLPDIMRMRLESAEQQKARVQVSSCCPKVVRLIEDSLPEAVPLLSAAPSPATHHCRDLRKRLGPDCVVVFATPCPDKADEALRPENSGSADEVITFIELTEWLDQRGAWEKAEAREFSSQAPYWTYAGLLVLDVSGMDSCRQLLRQSDSLAPGFYELLGCRHGCVGGPGLPNLNNIGVRGAVILEYIESIRHTS